VLLCVLINSLFIRISVVSMISHINCAFISWTRL